jgi:N-carbamoylputrescine amidase
MKVTVCQIGNRNDQVVPMLEKLSIHIQENRSDFLLLPEMCFSDWLAADPTPKLEYWYRAVKDHENQISKLAELGARAVMGTRPIVRKNGSLRNEAYIWSINSGAQPVHEK